VAGSAGFDLDQPIRINFNRTINPETLTVDNLRLSVGADRLEGEISSAGGQVTFQPAMPFGLLYDYSVVLTTGIQDSTGLSLAQDYPFSFSTRDGVWSAPAELTTQNSRPVFAAGGDNLLVWTDQYGVWASHYEDPTGWLRPFRISTPGARGFSNPRVTVDIKGNILVAWLEDSTGVCTATASGLKVAYLDAATQSWEGPTAISNQCQTIRDLQVAVTDGRAVVVWKQSDGTSLRLFGSVFTRGALQQWSVPVKINIWYASPPWNTEPTGFSLAMNEAGQAVVTWSQRLNYDRILVRRHEPIGGWGGLTYLTLASTTTIQHRAPRAVIDSTGRALVVWLASNPDGERLQYRISQAATPSSWGATQTITGISSNVQGHEIMIDARGNATLVALHASSGMDQVAALRLQTGQGSFSAPVSLSGEQPYINNMKIGIDLRGHAIAVWGEGDSDIPEARFRAARYRADTNSWDEPVTIGATGEGDDIYDVVDEMDPAIGIDSQGYGIVTWRLLEETVSRRFFSRFE